MKKKNTKTILAALGALAAFALWTVLIRCVDVQPIGPNGSCVGFAAINGAFHALTGVHWLSDIAGGVLLSAGLVELYALAVRKTPEDPPIA